MPRPIHFEINADDPERASQFYRDVFGWDIQKWQGPVEYWMVVTGPKDTPGINGGLMKRHSPNATTVNTIDVADLDAAIAKITESGGKVMMPRTPIPGVGYFAYCLDTENNIFGVMQSDAQAK